MNTIGNLDQFLSQAGGYGPCVALHAATPLPLVAPTGFEVRTLDGAQTKTLNSLFDTFAEAWHFPSWFGRNRDAFDDCMRDLDNMVNTATGKPPGPGYLTNMTDAHLILSEQPELFPWFAECMPVYRDYYRDEATPSAAFGLLLSVPGDQLEVVGERWLDCGIQISLLAT